MQFLVYLCIVFMTIGAKTSGFSAVGSARRSGRWGRWFESSNPDYSPKSGTYEHKRPILPLQEWPTSRLRLASHSHRMPFSCGRHRRFWWRKRCVSIQRHQRATAHSTWFLPAGSHPTSHLPASPVLSGRRKGARTLSLRPEHCRFHQIGRASCRERV